jgi:transposase InsO family protein
VERFNRTVLDEFFRQAFRTKFYDRVDVLAVNTADLDRWLHYYNYERPHQGYRNLGKRPFDTLKTVPKTD